MTTTPRWSIQLGRILGIPVRLHATFLLLVAFVAVAAGGGGWGDMAAALVWIAAVFGSVLLHEVCHCVVARRFGVDVKDVLLLPIGGLSEMERLPDRPGQELSIAAAGPACSAALGALALVVAGLIGPAPWPPTLMSGAWAARLGWLNVLLAGFNLLPAFPLDGGRVLRAALSLRWGRSRATDAAVALARSLAAVLVVTGLLYDLWLMFIGVFLYLAAGAEGREDRVRRVLKARSVGQAMSRSQPDRDEVDQDAIPLHPDDNLDDALDRLTSARPHALPVVDAAGDLVGVLHLDDVERMAA